VKINLDINVKNLYNITMKKQRTKTRSHFILFAEDSPFKAKTEVDRKRRAKNGYSKHRKNYR
jgi:hypothetical protein